MISLRRLDHVCLHVADLAEASARWQIQLGLVERLRERGVLVSHMPPDRLRACTHALQDAFLCGDSLGLGQ